MTKKQKKGPAAVALPKDVPVQAPPTPAPASGPPPAAPPAQAPPAAPPPPPWDPEDALTSTDLENLLRITATVPAQGAGLDLLARLRSKIRSASGCVAVFVPEKLAKAVGVQALREAAVGEAAALVSAAMEE